MDGSTFVKYDTWCWHWYNVPAPRPGGSDYVDSPTFCMEHESEIFYLSCDDNVRDGVVSLWLCRYMHASRRPMASFGVAVRVWEGYDDRRPHAPSSFNVCDWTKAHEMNVWQRETSKIEQMFPGFSQRRLLNFEIMITSDPGSLTCNCRQSIRTSADASAQTSLDAYSISSLETLSEDILRMQDSDDLDPEVELHCEGRTARAHRALLSVRSPVLATMLRADMKEGRTGIVHFKDMDADTFQLFVSHLHTGKLEQRESMGFDAALRLYQAGKMYQVDGLSRMCSQVLVENLKADSACDILVMADAHFDSHLAEAAMQYMLQNGISRPGNERWDSFCGRHPQLALKVANRCIKELADSSGPSRKRHRPDSDEVICVE